MAKRRSALVVAGVFILIVALLLVIDPGGLERETGESASGQLPSISSGSSGPGDAAQRTRSRVRDPRPTFADFLEDITPEPDLNDTSDGYFQGYLRFKDAERLQAENRSSSEVMGAYAGAYAFYKAVALKAPEWKAEMVRSRMEKTEDRLRELYLAQKAR